MEREVIFDIETQNSFADVNNDLKKFRISVVSIYDYHTEQYLSFTEQEINKLWPYLEKASRIIGYNSEHFDLPILHNYYPGNLFNLAHLDIMKVIYNSLGRRMKLDDIAKATLDDVSKNANGLQAIKWFQEGKIEEIKKYCEQDVKVTKEVYEFGLKHRQLFYSSFNQEMVPFAVDFKYDNQILTLGNTSERKINLTLPF